MKKTISIILKAILAVCPLILSILGIYLLFSYPYLGKKFNILISVVIILVSLIVICLFILGSKRAKRTTTVVAIIFSLLCSCGLAYADYIYYRLNNELTKISNSEEYIYSYIYVLKDSSITSIEELAGANIGLQPISNSNCSTFIIEELTKLNILETSYETTVFTNYTIAANALLTGEVNAIAVDEQGISQISEIFPEFTTSTKQLTSFKQVVQSDTNSPLNLATEPFTVLISGVDSREDDLSASANSDVIMLATFNPSTMKLSMTSIPRDTYLKVPCRGNILDKITHSGSGGITCTISTLENALDIDINYYVKINFTAVVSLVEAIGGIDVTVPLSFCEQDSSDTPDALCIDAGQQHLNGEQALALARHRKTLVNGDIGRGVNQQIVIEGIIKKLASGTILTSLDNLLSVVGNNVQTNMSTTEMYSLFNLLTTLGTNSSFSSTSALSISSSTIAGYGDLIYTDWADLELYYYIPYQSSLDSVSTEINRVLGLEPYPLPSNDFAFDANVDFDLYNMQTTDGQD